MPKPVKTASAPTKTGHFNYRFVTLITLFVLFFGICGGAEAGKIVDKSELIQKARSKGKVRVIIRFDAADVQALTVPAVNNPAVVPGQVASPQAVQADRVLSTGIKNAAEKLLRRLEKKNYKLNRRLKHIPYVALSVNEKALNKLETIAEAISVVEDMPVQSPEPPEPPVSLPPGSVPMPGSDSHIGAETSWNMGYTGSGWYVAILDTGILASHAMFAGKTIVEGCFSSNDVISGALSACPDGSDALIGPGSAAPVSPGYTAYGHGTHVAGIAAGDAPDMKGVAMDANILAVQVFSRFDNSPYCGGGDCVMSYVSDQTRALDWIYEMRHIYPVAAVNMSLGGGIFDVPCDGDSRKAAIDNLNAAGIAVIVSSGNDYSCDGIGAPACISPAVAVGAVEDGGVMAGFSNWNDNGMVDLMAPGAVIFSAVASGDNDYEAWNGTSMAAPFATGAWALLKQKRPATGVDDLLNAIQATAADVIVPCNWETVKRHIRVDNALQSLNRPPWASAGDDMVITEGTAVILDGRDSYDPDPNDLLTYEWHGPADIILSNSTSAQARFTAPQVAGDDRVLEFELTVQDNHNSVSTDTVRITITDPAPWVDAGADQNVPEGAMVTLDGSGSTDPGGNSSGLTYDWHQIGGIGVVLAGASTSVATFTAPPVGPAGDTLNFQLVVTDTAGQTGIGSCTVHVSDTANPPVANAGADQVVTEGVTTILDGSGSTDPDGLGDIESYQWIQIDGPDVVLQDAEQSRASFSAPVVGLNDQELAFQLTVTDRSGLTSSDICIVMVNDVNQVPISDAGLDQVTLEGSTVLLSGANSSDPDHDLLSYEWTQTAGEPRVVLSDSESVSPTFVTRLPEDTEHAVLTFQLKVTDPNGMVSTDDVQVVIQDNQIDGFPDSAVTTDTSNGTVGVSTENEIELVKLDVVEAASLPPADGDSKDYPYGLLDLAIKVPVKGMAISVSVQFEEPLPAHATWMKYNPRSGWQDYSGKVVFKKNKTLAVIELVDGGIGDDDGVANGIIVDPSGPAVSSPTNNLQPGGSGGGGCFITTMAGH